MRTVPLPGKAQEKACIPQFKNKLSENKYFFFFFWKCYKKATHHSTILLPSTRPRSQLNMTFWMIWNKTKLQRFDTDIPIDLFQSSSFCGGANLEQQILFCNSSPTTHNQSCTAFFKKVLGLKTRYQQIFYSSMFNPAKSSLPSQNLNT